jgi:hypothetical protein
MDEENKETEITRDTLSVILFRLIGRLSEEMEALTKADKAPADDKILRIFSQMRETRKHVDALYQYRESKTQIKIVNAS